MDDIVTLEPAQHRIDPMRGARIRHVPADDGDRVTKVAWGDGRAVLRREAEVLRTVPGADLVRCIDLLDGPETTELVLRDTGGPSLAAVLDDPATNPSDAQSLLVATCETVARLHANGWTHGRLRPDHVLLTTRGRIRLCSVSDALPIELDVAGARRDRVALLRMVDDWTAHPTGRQQATGRIRRLVAAVAARRTARRTARLPDDPDPVVLARVLERSRRIPVPPVSSRTALTVAGVALALTAAALVAMRSTDHRATTAGPPTTTVHRATTTVPTPTLPTTTAATVVGNVVELDGRRYRVGADGDVVAVGDWDCDGTATPAVLRTASGSVHVFSGWATAGRPVDATEVGRVDGAVSFVAPTACGPPVVATADGRAHEVAP